MRNNKKWLICLILLTLVILCSSCGQTEVPERQSKDHTTETGESDMNQTETKNNETNVPSGPKYDGYKTPCIVETLYTEDLIVADVVATDFGKNSADPSGQKDSSKALNAAIQKVYDAGGGTVYLPAGTYLLKEQIEVLPFVSLVGDYDPEGTGMTGTVILAEPEVNDEPLFEIGGSAGVVGLSVYYPNQDPGDVKAYGFTFSIPGSAKRPAYYMLSTVKDCKVFNGYNGIYAGSVNEQINIEGFCGTFLNHVLEMYDSADASSICHVHSDPSYWASCRLGSASSDIIHDYTLENGEAFLFGDLEWCTFTDLSCTGYKTGMHIIHGPRAKFSGMIYGLEMTDCEQGLLVDEIDERAGYGMAVTSGRIEGYEFAVKNNTKGKVQLTGVEFDGDVIKGTGALAPVVNETGRTDFPDAPASQMPPISKGGFAVVSGADSKAGRDVSDKIQAALDSLKETGGVVYLKAGYYLIEKPLIVPAGVELRGAGHVPVRDQMELSLGTIIFSRIDSACTDAGTAQANITLGAGSGLRNVIFVNISHDILKDYLENEKSFEESAYLIRGEGKGCYLYQDAVCGAVNGVEMINADNFHISHLSLLAYQTGIHVKSSDHSYICNVLTNVTIGFRNRWWGLSNYKTLFKNGFEENWEATINRDPDAYGTVQMMMDNLSQVLYEDAQDATLCFFFSYGARHTIKAYDSDVRAYNIGRDCYWKYVISVPMISVEGTDLIVFNQHRFNGTSYEADGESTISIYSRVTIGQDEECIE